MCLQITLIFLMKMNFVENTAECVTEKCTDDISDEESVISRDDPNYSPSKCSYSGSDSDINSDVSDEQLCDIENKEPSNVLTNGEFIDFFAIKESKVSRNNFFFNQLSEPEVNFEGNSISDSVPVITTSDPTLPGTSNEIISETPKTRKRKRFAVEEEWQRNVMKKKRALGQAYTNYKKIEKPAKTVVNKKDCTKCRYHCSEKIPKAQQDSLLAEYYTYGDVARQKDYICSLVSKTDVVRKRPRKMDSNVEKNWSKVYTLPNGENEKVRVCAEFFCATFAISKSVVEDAIKNKSPNGSYKGFDHRKGRPAPNATAPSTVKAVNRFLSKFPKVPSHYCRARSNRLYLSPDLSMQKLHELYSEKNENAPISYKVFCNLFHHFEPPLAIFEPKKDQCSTCNEAERTKTRETNEEYIAHIKRKDSIAAMKKQDKADALKDPSLIYATFDLQAILTLPFAAECQLYYTRKLSMYNFTIFDSRRVGTCYTWDENNGKKGSSEIGSCLMRYVMSLPETVNKIVFYSDTCGGQNRNQNVFALLLYIVNFAAKHIKTIDLKFMESGHSTMEADSMHSAIERAKKGKLLYVPNDYVNVMKMARKEKKETKHQLETHSYDVHLLQYDAVYDLQALTESIITNRNKTVSKKKVNWLLVKWFRFEKGSTKVGFKYDVNSDFDYIQANDASVPWDKITLKKKYQSVLPISMAKKRDLIKLLKKGIIPQDYATFYEKLHSSAKVTDKAVWDREFDEERAPREED